LKRNVLIVINAYRPSFKSGGPIKSIENLVQNLTSVTSDFAFYIVTKDRDSGDKEPFANIKSDTWSHINNANILYKLEKNINLQSYIKLFKSQSFDNIYINSFFNYKFTILPLMALFLLGMLNKVIIAPRGEFSEGALALKYFKKKIFIIMFNTIGIKNIVKWHSTSEEESSDIKNVLNIKATKIYCIPNLPSLSSNTEINSNRKKKPGEINLVYISRISKKKNLVGILRTLQLLKTREYIVNLNIYGTANREEDKKYLSICQKVASKLPSNINVFFNGAISPFLVPNELKNHDLFFLPTYGENFGHSIMEALQANIPILISNKTPWKELEEQSIGWSFEPDDFQSFANTIDVLVNKNEDEWNLYRLAAKNFVNKYMSDVNISILKYEQLFNQTTLKSTSID
jgi:glycosyltransferase involved in cell wall biosynthesis